MERTVGPFDPTKKKIAVVANNKAKNFDDHRVYLEALSASGLQHDFYEAAPDKLDAIIKKCVEDCDILLVGGGDGTIRSAAQYCAHTPILLGVMPIGTMNHFSKELGLPATADELVNALKSNHTVDIDVAEVNGWIFVNKSSIGF